jgi:signal transduction histidine kinase
MGILLELNSMADATAKELMDYGFDKAMELTGSTLGSFAVMSADGKAAIAESYSKNVMAECQVGEKPLVFPVDTGGVWTEIIDTRKPLILNDYAAGHPRKKGTPPGHVKIERLLIIPLIEEDRIVAMAQLANKPTDYDESDARQITLLLGGLWRTLSRKKAEQELLQAKAQVELYLDLMGHDINNMNMVAAGFLEIARGVVDSEGKLDSSNVALLDSALSSINNSSRLIDNVRKLQRDRMGEYRPEVYDLGKLVEEVYEQFRSAPDKDVKISYRPVRDVRVQANELLRDVFVNLIGNAIKHSRGPSIIKVTMEKDGHGLCKVAVEDNGPGIPDAMMDVIFDRFRRGDTKAHGTGLGLYLVKTIVEGYGGKVWVEDRVPGDHTKGARFVVTLPTAN